MDRLQVREGLGREWHLERGSEPWREHGQQHLEKLFSSYGMRVQTYNMSVKRAGPLFSKKEN